MPSRPDAAAGDDPGAAAATADWVEQIEAAVLGAEAQIEAVLDRVHLPLSAVLALKPGAMVPLSKSALTRVRVEGRGHRFVAWGRLGECQGHLAVRVHLGLQEDGEERAEFEPAAETGAPTQTVACPQAPLRIAEAAEVRPRHERRRGKASRVGRDRDPQRSRAASG